jgi:transcriptional regulator with XRE-family HTH domain
MSCILRAVLQTGQNVSRIGDERSRGALYAVRVAGADELAELGHRVRDRRRELGLSVRTLAAAAKISSSYLGAIESGRNPTTGRPPAPSLRVLSALAPALKLDVAQLVGVPGVVAAHGKDADHMLVYTFGRPGSVLPQIARLHGDRVEHWLYVPDPREPRRRRVAAEGTAGVSEVHWRFGSEPYPDRFLEPGRITEALREELRLLAPSLRSKRVGVAFSDCSAVMRWVENPEDEVDYEDVWGADVAAAVAATLGQAATATVCVYHHADLETLAHHLDLLAVMVKLLRTHDSVVTIAEDELRVGSRAATAMLVNAKPPGVSTRAWGDLARAAADGLHGPARTVVRASTD